MKTKFILITIAIALGSAGVFGQSVKISFKTVTYKRPKPIAAHKKTFTISYPKAKAATPAISRKIEAVLSYERVFGFKLRDELTTTQWLDKADYDVNFNADNILSIFLIIQGSGAYPSSVTKYIVVNIVNGTRVRPANVFVNTSGLLAKLTKMRDDEVNKAIADIKNDPETKDDDVSALFSDAETYHKVKLDEMEVDDNGIVFHHDYGFPHIAQALQPPGSFFLDWHELKPYIKRGSVFAQFVR